MQSQACLEESDWYRFRTDTLRGEGDGRTELPLKNRGVRLRVEEGWQWPEAGRGIGVHRMPQSQPSNQDWGIPAWRTGKRHVFVVLNHHWSSVVVGYSNITKTSLIGRSHLSLCSNFISSKDLFIQNTGLLSVSLCVSTWLYFSSLDLFSSRK